MLKKMLAAALAMAMLMSAALARTIVPYGEELTIETQVTADGKARLKGESDYETLSFTLRVTGNHGPMHFKKFYGEDFALRGNEAVAKIHLSLNSDAGFEINPSPLYPKRCSRFFGFARTVGKLLPPACPNARNTAVVRSHL